MQYITNMFQNLKKLPIYWYVLMSYLLLTGIVAVVFDPKIIITNRLIFIGLLCFALVLGRTFPKVKSIIHLILAYAFLGVIYKETAIIHPLFFSPIDDFLMRLDAYLFGIQPALAFSVAFPQVWVSELLFLGYFSYYLIPLIVIFSLRNESEVKINQFGGVLITSFVIYYLIFILIPAVGPQFYWDYPENHIEAQGFFGKIVKIIQANGEAPTAAFPSSHVGISVVILLWLYSHNRKLFFGILPFTTILIFSTVYIKAHYAVDVLAGLLSGILIYFITYGYYKRS
ncbi:phosphatase PAP2 family protein [Capnocytophaga canimorsus]|uniref:phosphatase PAP2 family protein n=1 Tax=Capnocytophaga canimorsus TaxID=28188 RepID=UPI0037D2FD07